MYIPQYQLSNLKKLIAPQKAVVVYGPRRCGKTTLVNEMLKSSADKYLFVSGEDIAIRDYLESESIEKLRSFIGSNSLLVIDEAQKVRNIGTNVKLILDHIPGIKVVATGSSSFDLAKHVGEPLTGRKFTLRLFPLAQIELAPLENAAESAARLEERLIYGSYPEVVLTRDPAQRIRYLKELVGSYLYKDILELEGVRSSDKLVRLLQLIVFQIGKEVSCTELGTQLGISKNTVERYLDLLEKAFVIFKLRGFNRNLRKEITKNARYYFFDTGIRNALVNNFNPLSMRDDVGMLWENYIICERMKKQEYTGLASNNYFWRTYDKKEIDLVEERGGTLHGYEIKWSDNKSRMPALWAETYPGATSDIITRDNYIPFIT